MQPLRLRKPDNNLPTFFPERLRGSTIGLSMWCDFDCLDKINSPQIPDELSEETDATATGTIEHKVLEESQGRRFPFETDLIDKLNAKMDPQLGFVRDFRGTKITVHPDDLQVTPARRVSVIEYKTTAVYVAKDKTWEQAALELFDFVTRWKFPMARLQTQVYAWVLDPILADLGYTIDYKHCVIYYDSQTFRLLGYPLIADYNPIIVESNLARIFDFIADPSKCIAPALFKCRRCAKVKREKCPHWLKLQQEQKLTTQ